MSDPLAYCQQTAAPLGSMRYYALRFGSGDHYQQLLADATLRQTINTVVYECQDPGVARSKLSWWRQEIARAAEGHASHPATQLYGQALPAASALALVNAVETKLDGLQFADASALEQHFIDLWGPNNPELAIAQGYADSILQLRYHAGIQYYPFAQTQLKPLAIDVHQLSANQSQCEALLAHAHQQSKNYFAMATPERPLTDFIFQHLQQRRLNLLAEQHYPVFTQSITEPPIRLLWHAWRCYRQCK